jgi:hypothetical protein
MLITDKNKGNGALTGLLSIYEIFGIKALFRVFAPPVG